MTCPHTNRVIDGVYSIKSVPVAASWYCADCRTNGATPWGDATDAQREQARLAEDALRPRSPEMMGRK